MRFIQIAAAKHTVLPVIVLCNRTRMLILCLPSVVGKLHVWSAAVVLPILVELTIQRTELLTRPRRTEF
jgi:hypothetical protein